MILIGKLIRYSIRNDGFLELEIFVILTISNKWNFSLKFDLDFCWDFKEFFCVI